MITSVNDIAKHGSEAESVTASQTETTPDQKQEQDIILEEIEGISQEAMNEANEMLRCK